MKHLLKALCLPILALGCLLLPAVGAVRASASVEVPRWEMHEFELHGRCQGENPFRDAALVGEFIAPSGGNITVEGFFDDGDEIDVLSQQTGQFGGDVAWRVGNSFRVAICFWTVFPGCCLVPPQSHTYRSSYST